MAASTSSPASRFGPRRYLPLRSVLVVSTTSTVCSAIHPRPGFPGQRSWGSAHPPGFPASRGPLRLRCDLPLLNLMTGPASAVTSASTRPSVLQGFAHRGDRRRSQSVSLLQGLVSLMGFTGWDQFQGRLPHLPKEVRPAVSARASSPATRNRTEVLLRSRSSSRMSCPKTPPCRHPKATPAARPVSG